MKLPSWLGGLFGGGKSKTSWLPWLGWLALFIWTVYTARAAGRAEGATIVLRQELARVQYRRDSIANELVESDRRVEELKETVKEAKAKVVFVDSSTKPNVDSALAELRGRLDSTGNALVARVVDGYEARLAARDVTIVEQDKLIQSQDEMVRLQKTLIAVQQRSDSVLTELWKNAEKRAKPNLLKRVVDALPIAAVIVLLFPR